MHVKPLMTRSAVMVLVNHLAAIARPAWSLGALSPSAARVQIQALRDALGTDRSGWNDRTLSLAEALPALDQLEIEADPDRRAALAEQLFELLMGYALPDELPPGLLGTREILWPI